MVAHLLRLAALYHHTAGHAYHSTSYTSSNSSRDAARDLLLYYHWLAKLPAREDTLLGSSRELNFRSVWCQAENGRYEVGQENSLNE